MGPKFRRLLLEACASPVDPSHCSGDLPRNLEDRFYGIIGRMGE